MSSLLCNTDLHTVLIMVNSCSIILYVAGSKPWERPRRCLAPRERLLADKWNVSSSHRMQVTPAWQKLLTLAEPKTIEDDHSYHRESERNN